jgi:hypothetical protein
MTKEVEVMSEMECVSNGVNVDVERIRLRTNWEAPAQSDQAIFCEEKEIPVLEMVPASLRPNSPVAYVFH